MSRPNSPALARYLELERALLAWRKDHPHDTREEDRLLDQMDDAWLALSAEDRAWLNARQRVS
jgi:hypothetical protein